ncbi:FecR family protein [Pseudomonas sp. EpS/L25]|uniref:FecR family protein n=1 Tax=Pseudomonas sp. EpS/L25 TaxID=1749078 RepID=UPI00074317D6|nr:FecR family protein [Pseudomonas sp. EpS/L25]KUM43957.1 hypothetical protein AR540_19490 [Pseudomonas sp. EpS/L25]
MTWSAEQQRLSEEAATWHLRLQAEDCSAAERDAFNAWCAQDPRHLAEYQAIETLWGLAGHLPPTPAQFRPRLRRRRLLRLSCALATCCGLWLAGWYGGLLPSSVRYYGATAGMQQISLPDGSQVSLNTHTSLFYGDFIDRRDLYLPAGQAFFEVHHDRFHPFTVKTRQGEIRVTGTRFDVWNTGNDLIVTVAEGRVRVTPEGRTQVVELTAGMQARYLAGHGPEIRHTDVQALLAWRQGQLVLDGQSLGEVLPLIGRYLERDVRVADAQAAAMRPGGIYSVAALEKLLYQLPKILPVEVTTQQDGSVLVASRYKAL